MSKRALTSLTGCKDIFDDPVFFKDGPTAGDVKQGKDGNCYLMAALCGLGNMKGLIDKVCVAKDEKVGVYGFVFYRGRHFTIVDLTQSGVILCCRSPGPQYELVSHPSCFGTR